VRVILVEEIDYIKPWAFFDGASQEDGSFCGGEVILHLLDSHLFKLKMGLSQGTNNFAELLTLKLLLFFAGEKDLKSLQVSGDSCYL